MPQHRLRTLSDKVNNYVEHTGPIWSIAVTREILVTGSSDQTIKIWSLSADYLRLAHSHTLSGHAGIVHALALYGGKTLISGSDDKTICFWDLTDMRKTDTLRAHANTVCELHVRGNLLFSGSYQEIIVHELRTHDHVNTLRGLNHWVYSMESNESFLFAGSHNMIKVFNLETLEEVHTIKTRQGKSIYSLVATERFLFSGTYEKTIDVFDITTFENITTFRAHEASVLSLAVVGNLLFSGSYDKTIKMWSMDDFKFLQQIEASGKVESLASFAGVLYSGSTDAHLTIFAPVGVLPK